MVGSSDIDKCCRSRCWEEFALSALAVGRSIDVAPDPGLARLNRAPEDILSSGCNSLAKYAISFFDSPGNEAKVFARGQSNLQNRQCGLLGYSQGQ